MSKDDIIEYVIGVIALATCAGAIYLVTHYFGLSLPKYGVWAFPMVYLVFCLGFSIPIKRTKTVREYVIEFAQLYCFVFFGCLLVIPMMVGIYIKNLKIITHIAYNKE